MDKEFLLNRIKNLNKKIVNEKIFYYLILEKDNEIKIFFNKKTLNIIGWQTKDIYQNVSVTNLKSIKVNQKINENLFKLPLQN